MAVRFPRVTDDKLRGALHRVHRMVTVYIHRPAHLAIATRHPKGSVARRSKAVKPHRIYTIAPFDLLKPDPLAHAREVGWHSLDLAGGDAVVTRRVAQHPKTGKVQIVQVDRGSLGAAIVEAMSAVKKRTTRGDFEFRVLLLAPLFTTAIWLHRKKGGDVIIPLSHCDMPVKPHHAYTSAEFFKLAHPLVEALSPSEEPRK